MHSVITSTNSQWLALEDYTTLTPENTELFETFISQTTLYDFLQLFSRARRLVYNPSPLSRINHTVTIPSFTDAIRHLRDSLEELSVIQEGYELEDWPDADIVPAPSLKSLLKFKRLKILEASAHILVGGDDWVHVEDTNILEIGVLANPDEVEGSTSDDSFWSDVKSYLAPYYDMKQTQSFVSEIPSALEHLTIARYSEAVFKILDAMLAEIPPANLRTASIRFRNSESPRLLTGDNSHRVGEDWNSTKPVSWQKVNIRVEYPDEQSCHLANRRINTSFNQVV
jgi:hypothetical protein